MLGVWCAASAVAGDLYSVSWGPESVLYEQLDTTRTGDGTIVTYPDQAVELVVLADLSGSINKEEAHQMGLTMETIHELLVARSEAGDRFAVTAFASRPQRWIPIGPLRREGIEAWIDRFGAPRTGFVDPLSYGDLPDALPVPPDPRAIDTSHTDAAKALDTATDDLRSRGSHALKVVVLLWDGGHNGFGKLQGALDRAWAEEIHVWSVSFTKRPLGPLVTRGGGDAYVVTDCGPLVAERIVRELRFDP